MSLKKTCFPLSLGGAMTLAKYWRGNLFDPGLLQNVLSLVQIQPFTEELLQLLVSWQN